MAKVAPAVDSMEVVPEAAREWYARRDDGEFVLQLEGAPSGYVPAEYRDRVEEFRSRNSALSNQLADLERPLKAYDGIEPDAARQALTNARRQPSLTRVAEPGSCFFRTDSYRPNHVSISIA
jgi:hypothetical protein